MIIDANVILRCILNDDKNMALQAKNILEQNNCFAPNEVIAEVVFVLLKVYKVPRSEICLLLTNSFKYYKVQDIDLLRESLHFFSETNLDFVDCILAAYHSVKYENVFTFDKKLSNFMNRI